MSIEGRQDAGRRIEVELLDRDWTQADLAAKAKIGEDTVSDLINARTIRPRPRTLRSIEDVFDWGHGTIRGMFDGAEPPPRRRAGAVQGVQKPVRYHTRADAREAMSGLDEETFERVWTWLQGFWAAQDQTGGKGSGAGGSQIREEGV